jgi:hypothetical protein
MVTSLIAATPVVNKDSRPLSFFHVLPIRLRCKKVDLLRQGSRRLPFVANKDSRLLQSLAPPCFNAKSDMPGLPLQRHAGFRASACR